VTDHRLLRSLEIVLVPAVLLFSGCLSTDDGSGSNERSDSDRDVQRDVAAYDTANDESDAWPPNDLGRLDTGSDGGTDAGFDATDVTAEPDTTTVEDVRTEPDTGPMDPLSCSLVDFSYGPIWDGAVDSPTTGSEPSPMTGITEAHNAVRRFIGVPDLSWSSSLATSSQTWADYLADNQSCGLMHDPNNDYGENLYAYSTSGTLDVTPQDVVGGWSCEREDWDNDAMTCQGVSGFSGSTRSCGHYTQVVWDDTTQVGCAVATCNSGGFNSIVWVCRYSPPGNWIGERPYGD